mmetsp:Transcript_121026/g.233539  ORF Transcript_121026/g.233539 Transcript_121026/m.233539 type:complete len:201 (+) Transcript_121026:1240-1842(+)
MDFRKSAAACACFFSSFFRCSKASRCWCSALPASTRFFNCSTLACVTLRLSLRFVSSAFASASGPWKHSRRSKLFSSMKSTVLPIEACTPPSALSRPFMKEAYAVKSSKYDVPWLPCIVTQPLAPLFTTLISMRVIPKPSTSRGSPKASTTSSTSSFASWALEVKSGPSVKVMPWTHTKRSWKIFKKSEWVKLPSLSWSR